MKIARVTAAVIHSCREPYRSHAGRALELRGERGLPPGDRHRRERGRRTARNLARLLSPFTLFAAGVQKRQKQAPRRLSVLPCQLESPQPTGWACVRLEPRHNLSTKGVEMNTSRSRMLEDLPEAAVHSERIRRGTQPRTTERSPRRVNVQERTVHRVVGRSRKLAYASAASGGMPFTGMRAVDELLRNSEAETASETEKSFYGV